MFFPWQWQKCQGAPKHRHLPTPWPHSVCQCSTVQEKRQGVGRAGQGRVQEILNDVLTSQETGTVSQHDDNCCCSASPSEHPWTLLCLWHPASSPRVESISHFTQSSMRTMHQLQMPKNISVQSVKYFLLFIALDYPCFCSPLFTWLVKICFSFELSFCPI